MKINEAKLTGCLLLIFSLELNAAAAHDENYSEQEEYTQKAAADKNKKKGWKQKFNDWWNKPSDIMQKTGEDVGAGAAKGAVKGVVSQIGKDAKGEDLPISKAIKQAVNDSGQEAFKWYKKALGLTVCVVGGSIVSYWLINWFIEYIKSPKLISEYIYKAPCECMIFSEVNQKKINDFTKTTIDINKQKLAYSSLLISGPTGTGKTQLVKKIASECEMNLVIIDGAEFAKFDRATSLREMDHLFEWANKQNNIILLFDKAETFLDNPNNDCLSEDYKLIANFLKHIEEPSSKYMITLTTSYVNLLDKTVLKKINEHIKTELPQIQERVRLIKLFVDQMVDQVIDKKNICELISKIFSEDKIAQISKITEGLSCYELHDIITKIKTKLLIMDHISDFNENTLDGIVVSAIEKNKKKLSN